MQFFYSNNDLLRNKEFWEDWGLSTKDKDVVVFDPDTDHTTPSLSAEDHFANVVKRCTRIVRNTLNPFGLATPAWNGCD